MESQKPAPSEVEGSKLFSQGGSAFGGKSQGRNSKFKIIVAAATTVMLLGVVLWAVSKPPRPVYANLPEFAQCLAANKVTMYGAAWCPHCRNEKKRFGESFKYVPYVECPDSPQLCTEKGITGYPTWIFSDGRRFEGEMGLEKLSIESGCTLIPFSK